RTLRSRHRPRSGASDRGRRRGRRGGARLAGRSRGRRAVEAAGGPMRTPRARIVGILAAREVRAALRGRWLPIGGAAFAVLTVAVAQLGMAGATRWGISTFDRTAAALVNLVLLFVPLLALPLATASFTGEVEDGTLAYLSAQPVGRGELFVGKLCGLGGAM